MYTSVALLDIHQRCHRSFGLLMEHCRVFNAEQFNREFEGFGYPTMRLQIHHVIGAQKYWLSVVQDRMNADEDDSEFQTIDDLEALRAEVFESTEAYLRSVSDEELNTRREMLVWGGKRPSLMPALVILRTQTHIFQHMGQITAMCRLFGKPAPAGMDFSLQ
jgi:uncharacterized damage-inducible protein DinB